MAPHTFVDQSSAVVFLWIYSDFEDAFFSRPFHLACGWLLK